MDYEGPVKGYGPWKCQWYSPCSRHTEVDLACERCISGVYLNSWRVIIGRRIFRLSPRLWQWWANR